MRSVVIFLVGVALGMMLRCCGHEEGVADCHTDTVRTTDTVRVTIVRPVAQVSKRLAARVERLPVATDSAVAVDSVMVEVPMEQVSYDGEGYHAVVSGHGVSLDSLILERHELREMVTSAVMLPARKSRWGINVTAGVGVTPAGIQPMVGVGISYRLWEF